MAAGTLRPHFQPIVALRDGHISAHEALIRTPPDCRWQNPDALFAAARLADVTIELEIECLRLALTEWARCGAPSALFLNLSAAALVAALAQMDIGTLLSALQGSDNAPCPLVIEITEHEHVRDVAALVTAVGQLRRHRVKLALDDFGDGRSSLRLWSELKPEFVKIDKYFTADLQAHADKLQTLRALKQIADVFGTTLVAEGIESSEVLHLVRDLGVGLGQGWALGRPQAEACAAVPPAALAVIGSRDVAVFPERRRNTQQRASAWSLLQEVPALPRHTTNEEMFRRFNSDESLAALAIVDGEQPIGLVGRQRFIDCYARPFFREVHGRGSCTQFANMKPRLVDIQADMDDLTSVLTSDDQRYLAEGLIITEGGRYRGLGRAEDLVRAVTESRMEAARHANPLTLLPGNIPLTQHIQRLLASGRDFVACYCDLNHFKPFNDLYGYWRGDEMIQLASRCITAQADARRDFVGHVGGDDFVVLFQSDDWAERCDAIVTSFNLGAMSLYDAAAREAAGVMAEDRFGTLRFHPLTTISIGAVRLAADGSVSQAEAVASAAARAKRWAKHHQVGLYVLDDWQVVAE